MRRLVAECLSGAMVQSLYYLVTESFFGNLKYELVHHGRFATRQEAKDKLFDYIEVFYNRMRIHSTTDYFAPAEYEARYRAQLKQAARGSKIALSLCPLNGVRFKVQPLLPSVGRGFTATGQEQDVGDRGGDA